MNKRPPFAFLPTPTGAELLIYGDIGEPDWSGPTSVSARAVADQLATMADATEIAVRINSYGGSVADGLAIYNALSSHPARVVVTVEGIAASSASMIAMAGTELRMHPASLLMIHAPWTVALGNARELQAEIATLEVYASAMAEAYARKTGRPAADIKAELLDGSDHWFTGAEAVAAGLADVLIEDPPETLDAAALAGLSRYASRAPAPIAAALRPPGDPDMSKTAPQDVAAAALAADRSRRAEIRAMFARFPDQDVAELGRACEDDPDCTPEAAGKKLLAKMAAGSEPLGGGAARYSEGVPSYGASAARAPAQRSHDFLAAAADGLLMRAGVVVRDAHPAARDFAGMSLVDIAGTVLSRAGRTPAGFNSGDVIRAAMSTSDFPALLANVATKSLRQGYEAEPQSHRAWVRESRVEDFKTQYRPIRGSAPELLQVLEGAEYQLGSMDEDQAQFAVSKFGRAVRLTWEALVNDDLGAFARAQQAMGQAAARREADEVYALLAANAGAGQTMQDSVALFDAAAHNNVTAAASELDAVALSAARTLLRKQTALGGGLLNLQPRFLLVPAELESEAEMLLAASTRHLLQSGNVEANTPTWLSSLQLVVEPRLADDAVYVMAAPPQIDTMELAFLNRDGGPVVFEEPLPGSDDMQYRIRHVFGARFLDWRGVVKVPLQASGG